ncbi:hypothetical protein BJG92_02057 [Arthrobacter sp. SO5]|uniref:VOC family protein n=1 Tax=Arthrobacter sp. SO5 TaxID=1897055 RepID=UPI001E5BCD30|nr:VOC family protein [Arthrobacter sp. SO5]MCB5274521.1 hypothetical protein [Arthrobacter sp. SO5]
MSGQVVHFEIPAEDTDRAREFYSSVFQWGMRAMPGMGYDLIQTPPTDEAGMPAAGINGGMFRREGELVAPIVVIDVDDIDAVLEKIGALGGSTVVPKVEVPGMGWNAYFRDSEGNVVGLWQNAVPEGAAAAAGDDIGA